METMQFLIAQMAFSLWLYFPHLGGLPKQFDTPDEVFLIVQGWSN